jgi:hypothetical protein
MAEKLTKQPKRVIKPQPGYQEAALSNSADILISGAAAGVGKTFALLLEAVRNISVPGFGAVIFRRTTTQIRNEGGLWDTSLELYTYLKGEPKESYLEWSFAYGNKIKFSHLEYEKNIIDWQGAQIPFIGFDEITHFTKKMFFYLLSRNRSVCGVKPYVRATCNPDPESWVTEFISWWIDSETGFAIPERDGVVRYVVLDGDTYIWGDTEEEVIEKANYLIEPLVKRSGIDPKEFVKSVSFVTGSIYDNRELMKINPGYLANLLSQDEATKASLLHSNWKAVLSDKDLYNYYSFIGMFENLYDVIDIGSYITADIALEGSNKLVICVWSGFELINIEIIDKSDGKQVVEGISALAKYHNVQNKYIAYDNDGVGGFVKGFIVGAYPFSGGIPAIEVTDPASGKKIKENYFNLKTQCFYRSAKNVNDGKYKISKLVANKMYDDKMTVRQRFMHERKAIKKDKIDSDGKLRIISKAEMKAKLNGESPDLMDMFMMREVFELKPKFYIPV